MGKWSEFEYGFKNYPEYAGRYYPDRALTELAAEKYPRRLVYITMRDLKRKPLPPELTAGQATEKIYSNGGLTGGG